jgi:hypothetical protein
MRGISKRTAGLVLLATYLALLFLPSAMAQVSSEYFEPLTDESKQWTLWFLNQQFYPDHIYGNFSYGQTYVEPPMYVLIYITDTIVIDDIEYEHWNILQNTTSAPYECNFSTLDYSIGLHRIGILTCYEPRGGLDGGGRTYFFEHQDRSGEQVVYTGASIAVVGANIASIFGVVFACYKVYKISKQYSKARTSRFERDAVVLR